VWVRELKENEGGVKWKEEKEKKRKENMDNMRNHTHFLKQNSP
jgi:hypothetical protein